jgi:hypothetical protein
MMMMMMNFYKDPEGRNQLENKDVGGRLILK